MLPRQTKRTLMAVILLIVTSCCVVECMNEWMNERRNEWKDEWKNERNGKERVETKEEEEEREWVKGACEVKILMKKDNALHNEEKRRSGRYLWECKGRESWQTLILKKCQQQKNKFDPPHSDWSKLPGTRNQEGRWWRLDTTRKKEKGSNPKGDALHICFGLSFFLSFNSLVSWSFTPSWPTLIALPCPCSPVDCYAPGVCLCLCLCMCMCFFPLASFYLPDSLPSPHFFFHSLSTGLSNGWGAVLETKRNCSVSNPSILAFLMGAFLNTLQLYGNIIVLKVRVRGHQQGTFAAQSCRDPWA